MASPFNIFRKYQKTLLVIAGVILMFVFVIGDALMSYLGGGSGGAGRQGPQAPNATAVSWNGGSLTNAEIDQMVFKRRLVKSFLQAIEYGGAQAAIDAGVEPRPLRVERLQGAETPQQGVEADVVRTKLFADLASQAGMRISDETIRTYLDELGRQHVNREDMRNAIQRMPAGNQRMTIDMMFDAIREEMLARNFLAGYTFALATVTPEQRWNDWRRVNDRVVIEAVPVPMEKFIVDVPEPSDAQLAAFVEGTDEAGNKYNYLEREPLPDLRFSPELPSSVPGFAIPRKIDVQYLLANYDQFLTKVEGEITDEEIKKFYNDNKDNLFIKLDTGLFDDAPREGDEGSSSEGATRATESEDTGDAGAPEAGTSEAGGASATEADGVNGAEGQAPPATDETQPPAEGASGETPPGEGDQSSRGRATGESPFRLTAFLQEEKAAEGATEAAPTTDAAPAAEATAAEPADDAAATGDAPVTVSPPAEVTTPAAEEKPKEYQPLDEVRDEIRRELAGQRVTKQLIDLFDQLKSQLNSEFTKYFATTIGTDAEGQELPTPPPALADLAKLAEQHGLSHGKTGLKSALEVRDDTPIGKLVDLERSNERMEVPLISTLFSDEAELYQPFSAYDVDANRFIVQKIGETPRRVPTLAEVKDDVIRAWKKQKAYELAKKNAEELAKRIQASGSTLADYYANDPAEKDKVLRTDPFSWLTGGEVSRFTGQQQPFRLGEPDGIVAAGPEFMTGVFGLDDGQVGAAPNHDHTVVYVVRVDSHQMPDDAMRTAFLAEANNWPGLTTTIRGHMQEATGALVTDVEKAADIKWERPKDNELRPEAESEAVND